MTADRKKAPVKLKDSKESEKKITKKKVTAAGTKKKSAGKDQKVFISEADEYLFAQGTHYDIYEKLGAHPSVQNGVKGIFFGVWAPNAESVHVIGTFNNWDENAAKMEKIGPGGIHTLFIPGVGENELYKFMITTPAG